MAKAEFTKGQRVNVFFGDHRTAAVTFTEYTVASCGAKQLHLIRADGSNAEFRCYAPFRKERMYSDVQAATIDPVAHAATLRKLFASWIAQHYEVCTQRAEEGLRNGSTGAQGYAKCIAEDKAKFEAATADLRA